MRRTGKSYAHPFIVLIASANSLSHSRIGVSAGRSLGNAVQRNRAKRRLRHAIQEMEASIAPGWDIVLLARKPCLTAEWPALKQAVWELSQKAELINQVANNYAS